MGEATQEDLQEEEWKKGARRFISVTFSEIYARHYQEEERAPVCVFVPDNSSGYVCAIAVYERVVCVHIRVRVFSSRCRSSNKKHKNIQ